MSKIVKVSQGDYRVVVRDGGTITLDTGWQLGNVVISGSLTVHGDYTTVQSETMVVKDNLIVINDGETGNGITGAFNSGIAGLQIDRGLKDDVYIIFDENVDHFDPVASGTAEGTFVLKDNTGRIKGIRTNSINTNGGDLGLINQGSGTITVTGTSFYEENVLDYSDWDIPIDSRAVWGTPAHTPIGPITLTSDPDAIPTTQAMADFVQSQLAFFSDNEIAEGDTLVHTYDDSVSGGSSRIVFQVNGVEKGQFNDNGLNVNNVRILSNTITNTNAGQDLILTATNSNVKVSGYLNLVDQVSAPTSTSGVNKLYAKATTGPGDTGLYFVNTRSGENFAVAGAGSEELVSKKRALLFSIIF
jgi:hypothetical protein